MITVLLTFKYGSGLYGIIREGEVVRRGIRRTGVLYPICLKSFLRLWIPRSVVLPALLRKENPRKV